MGENAQGNVGANVAPIFTNLSSQENDLLVALLAKAKGASPAPAPSPKKEEVVAIWASPQDALVGILALNPSASQLGRKGAAGWAVAECRGGCGGFGGKWCPRCGSRKSDGSISGSRLKREAKAAAPKKSSTVEELLASWAKK